jgi:hypothetical protein
VKKTEDGLVTLDEVRKEVRENKLTLLEEILVELEKKINLVASDLNKSIGCISTCNDLEKVISQLFLSYTANEEVSKFKEEVSKKLKIISNKESERHFILKGKLDTLESVFKAHEYKHGQIIAMAKRPKVKYNKKDKKKDKENEKE